MMETSLREQLPIKRLERGEIVTGFRVLEGELREAFASVLYPEEPEAVWHILCDLEHYTDFMPYTHVAEILREEGDEVWFRTEIQLVVNRIGYTLKMQRDHANLRLSWTLVDGDLTTNDGSWQLEPYEGSRTLTHYSLRIDPGVHLPRALLDYLTRRSLPEVIKAVGDRLRDRNSTRRLKRPTFVDG